MIRIFTHTTCADCPFCDNYLNVKRNGYAICSALKDIDPLSGLPFYGKEVPPDMSECPFPVTELPNDPTPGRMLLYSDCSECPGCSNPHPARITHQSMCRAYITSAVGGKITRGKYVNAFMGDCPFPEGRRFRGINGDTIYGIGIHRAGFPAEDMPVWVAATQEGKELARAFTREDLLNNLKRLELFKGYYQ